MRRLLSLFAFSVSIPVLSAQVGAPQNNNPPPTSITLPQALELAHRANPTLLAADRHLAAVRDGEVTASLRQNPTAVIGSQMTTLAPSDPNGPPFYQAGVQRLFERGNKRGLRLQSARATTSLSGFQLDDQRRALDLQVRQAFSRMLYAQSALAISQENLTGYRRTVSLMATRLSAGAIDQTDYDRVELQLANFESDLENAQLVLRQGAIALQTLLGVHQPVDDFAVTGALEPGNISATLDEFRAAALANRPDLKAAEAQIALNEATVKLAKANGTADPTLEVEYERSGGANTAGGSINLPLRVFDRNQGEKDRAAHELESSRLALVASRDQVLSDVESAWAAYLSAQTQSARYRTKYLAEAAHVRDNLEFSYRNGNTTLLDYLSAMSDYRQVNLASLNSQLQVLLALEQLAYAAHTEILP